MTALGGALIDAERLRKCKESPSYRAIATDVFTLVALFKEHWSAIGGRTPVTMESLHHAGTQALELLGAMGDKDQGPVSTSEAQLARQQAYTLFLQTYDDVRSAVTYPRRKEGDVNKFIPTFYPGRAGRGGSASSASSTGETQRRGRIQARPACDEPRAPRHSNQQPAQPADRRSLRELSSKQH